MVRHSSRSPAHSRPVGHPVLRRAVLVVGVLSLAACASPLAHPDFLKAGMSSAQLDSQFGKPVAERHEGNDDIRIYSSQPLGQRASAAHVSDGRVTAVEPLLNTEHFALIAVNDWNQKTVRDHFGPPAEIRGTREYPIVWSYRYKEANVWDSLFSVMFDSTGTVRMTQNGPDPMYSKDGHDNGR
jgi:hypothetical protein